LTHIAIIEDSPIEQCYQAACLRKAGWKVDSIDPTGTIAIVGHLLENPPSLLVLDYMLHQFQGDAIADVCNRHPDLKEIPIIVLTAHKDPALCQRLLTLGVREVLHKPIKANHLVAVVRKYLTK
jgi:CheY-like chemotaxis protein